MARRRKQRTKGLRLTLCVICAIGLFFLGQRGYKIYQLHQEQAAVQARIEELQKQKKALEQERRLLDDPRYIEKLAREDYNMVGQNEVPLFIIEDKKEPAPTDSTSQKK